MYSDSKTQSIYHKDEFVISECIAEAWKNIAPCWPIKNIIATNPLQGFEQLPFEEATNLAASYFQQRTIPSQIEIINLQTIKWCQAFFDEGQASIQMPFRHLGLYRSWLKLARFDKSLFSQNKKTRLWFEQLPESADHVVSLCLDKLNIPTNKRSEFLTLLLTTLPGWASYVKYRTEWDHSTQINQFPVSKTEYLALRLVITCLVWPEAVKLVDQHKKSQSINVSLKIAEIESAEKKYTTSLINSLTESLAKPNLKQELSDAQFIFCIDTRSEPFRRALESQGNYETFGIAGFFGIPVELHNEFTDESYASCPVLLKTSHKVNERMVCSKPELEKVNKGKEIISMTRRAYQSLKYAFTTPFAIVEMLGPWSGLWMMVRTLSPKLSTWMKQKIVAAIRPNTAVRPNLLTSTGLDGIDINDQYNYAESALSIIGLTKQFAPYVILCGHGSETQNNAYASALDCGACGGNKGLGNARVLAAMLNNNQVREHLAQKNILIPKETVFIAALHNTTTDQVTFELDENLRDHAKIKKLQNDLSNARQINNQVRAKTMGHNDDREKKTMNYIINRSQNWSITRPEWGLARNASFIVGPRSLTNGIDLDGRSFLHSYHWENDHDGKQLTTILTAPMVVAQWINSQYLFSTFDNIAYGSGSKITQNITGKMGIIQGNGSDLMHGLPIQSVYSSDTKNYHELLRLTTIVNAPRALINDIILNQPVLQKLFGNGWVNLLCIEPHEKQIYKLNRDFTWTKQTSVLHVSA